MFPPPSSRPPVVNTDLVRELLVIGWRPKMVRFWIFVNLVKVFDEEAGNWVRNTCGALIGFKPSAAVLAVSGIVPLGRKLSADAKTKLVGVKPL